MKRNTPILVALLALILIGASALQISVLKYPAYSAEPVVVRPAEYQQVELPFAEGLGSPHAILVLDVSGSMKTSDPQRLESEAVRQFYSVYRDLSREILRKGDQAKVALILFSTLAQVVDWDGEGQPWLTVDDANTNRFLQVVGRYLGGADQDPRAGWDTDYLAALAEVKRLASGLNSPPAVLFLTDGKNEPHPLLSPVLTAEARRIQYPELWDRNRALLGDIEAGRHRFLSASAGTAFDRRKAGVPDMKTTSEVEGAARRLIHESVTVLLQQRFFLSSRQPAVPLFWQPLFLGTEEVVAARDLLAPPPLAESGTGDSLFIQCRDARELPAQFINALSVWLRLSARPIPPQASRLQVPTDTQAFALTLETASPGTRFLLRSATQQVSLAGRSGVWAGVARGGGDWEIQGDGLVERGRLFLHPRYEWALHAPLRQTIAHNDDLVRLELYLLSLETGAPVLVEQVYPELPGVLPLLVSSGEGGRQLHLDMTRSPRQTAAYIANFTVPDLPFGLVDVEVDLKPLERAGITIPAQSLTQRIELRPNVRVVVTTTDGHPASIALRNAPREASRLRGIWERIYGGRH